MIFSNAIMWLSVQYHDSPFNYFTKFETNGFAAWSRTQESMYLRYVGSSSAWWIISLQVLRSPSHLTLSTTQNTPTTASV